MTIIQKNKIMKINEIKIPIDNSRNITLETGKLARQADGSVVVRMGNTMLLAAVVSNSDDDTTKDFLPLSVDYRERFAAAGRIPGGFLKREGPLSEHEILVCRLVDRALRPLFPDNYFFETQVNIFLISSDQEVVPDSLACLAASAAIAVSDIPFTEPVAEVRVARINSQWKINPAFKEISPILPQTKTTWGIWILKLPAQQKGFVPARWILKPPAYLSTSC